MAASISDDAPVLPVAAVLGLCCLDCGGQLEDRLGPFWCPRCRQDVSVWTFINALVATAADRKGPK